MTTYRGPDRYACTTASSEGRKTTCRPSLRPQSRYAGSSPPSTAPTHASGGTRRSYSASASPTILPVGCATNAFIAPTCESVHGRPAGPLTFFEALSVSANTSVSPPSTSSAVAAVLLRQSAAKSGAVSTTGTIRKREIQMLYFANAASSTMYVGSARTSATNRRSLRRARSVMKTTNGAPRIAAVPTGPNAETSSAVARGTYDGSASKMSSTASVAAGASSTSAAPAACCPCLTAITATRQPATASTAISQFGITERSNSR